MNINECLELFYIAYVKYNEEFEDTGNDVAAVKARKALSELMKLSKERRKQIQIKRDGYK